MKKLLLAIVALAAFSACSSDDAPDQVIVNVTPPLETENPPPGENQQPVQNETPTAADLVGTWLQVEQQNANGGWETSECEQLNVILKLVYTSNGTFTTATDCQIQDGIIVVFPQGNYSVEGGVVTWSNTEAGTLTQKVVIEDGTTMIVQPFSIVNGQTNYQAKVKFKKQ